MSPLFTTVSQINVLNKTHFALWTNKQYKQFATYYNIYNVSILFATKENRSKEILQWREPVTLFNYHCLGKSFIIPII